MQASALILLPSSILSFVCLSFFCFFFPAFPTVVNQPEDKFKSSQTEYTAGDLEVSIFQLQ